MPRRPRNRRGTSTIASAENRIVTIRGSSYLYFLLNSPASSTFKLKSLDIDTATLNSSRLNYLAETYNVYRFTRLEFILHPNAYYNNGTTSAFPFATFVGYQPVVTDYGPTTLDDIAETQTAMMFSDYSTVPRTMRVSNPALTGTLAKWLRTKSGSADANFQYHGVLFVGHNVTSTASYPEVWFEVRWEVQFKDPAAVNVASLTRPLPSSDRDDEKEVLVSVAPNTPLSPSFLPQPSVRRALQQRPP